MANYAQRLASQVPNVGWLELLVDQMFGKSINDLTGFEASSLIDQLKAMKDGHAPQSMSDKHYTQIPQDLLDDGIRWLGKELNV